MQPYVIQQGDFLSKLAYRFGVDPGEIWNHPDNEALKNLRGNPDLLLPGDILKIPEPPDEALDIKAQTTNRYQGTVPTVKVKLVLKDGAGEPRADLAYTIHGLREPLEGTTDGDGKLEIDAPIDVALLTMVLDGDPERYRIRVGHLDPVETDGGLRQRLRQLGVLSRMAADNDEELRDALERFQQAQGLEVSGEADDATRQKLVKLYGA